MIYDMIRYCFVISLKHISRLILDNDCRIFLPVPYRRSDVTWWLSPALSKIAAGFVTVTAPPVQPWGKRLRRVKDWVCLWLKFGLKILPPIDQTLFLVLQSFPPDQPGTLFHILTLPNRVANKLLGRSYLYFIKNVPVQTEFFLATNNKWTVSEKVTDFLRIVIAGKNMNISRNTHDDFISVTRGCLHNYVTCWKPT